MAEQPAKRYTRTAGEWIGGIIRCGLAVTVVVGIFAGIATLVVDNVADRFGYHFHIGPVVPGAGALGLGLVATVAYAWLLRPKPVNARRGSGDWTAAGRGRVWAGADADVGDGRPGRHSADVT